MTRPRRIGSSLGSLLSGAALLGLVGPTLAQTPAAAPAPTNANAPTNTPRAGALLPARPELIVLQLFRADPVLAPYGLSTAYRDNKVVVLGVVGTKQLHDMAIRLAIASGYPIRDDLVIDTSAVHRVASIVASAGSIGIGASGVPALGASAGFPPYVYPPPLFGRIDDPFFGFEPPLLTYPPWFGAVAARAGFGNAPAANPGAMPLAAPATNPAATNPAGATSDPIVLAPTIEMTLDARGVAVLRGTVATLDDRVAIGQRIAQTQGVSEVVNLLNVDPRGVVATETPPPPPQPGLNPRPNPPAPAVEAERLAPRPGIAVDAEGSDLSQRLAQALARRPALVNLPIRITVQDGVASLSGNVPTVYEAMLAFRAVQQTPGVRELYDRLEFAVPDEDHKNPLIDKGRPEDVEPYLLSQVRRHIGDVAHVDQLRLRGDTVEIRGTLRNPEDKPRLEATLRSIPVLRGFRLEPVFQPD
jgi:hypothetical protein